MLIFHQQDKTHQYIRALNDKRAGLVLWYHCLDQRKAIANHLRQRQHSQGSFSRRMSPKKGYLITHLYKGPQFCELFKDIQGYSVQAGLPPHCIISWHPTRMRFLVDKPEQIMFIIKDVKEDVNESGCPTFRSWQGVCPKLLMMPSKAFRSVSLAIASKSTAPAGQQAARLRLIQERRENDSFTFSHPHKCNSRTH